jgi:hypothetical protein
MGVVAQNQPGDLMGEFRVLDVAGEVAAADHGHPDGLRALGQEATHQGFPHRIPGAADATHLLIAQEVFKEQLAQFMGQLKSLD